MIERSIVHLSELLKDIAWPVSIYLVYLSSVEAAPSSEPPHGYSLR
jgi:hypothetical protein